MFIILVSSNVFWFLSSHEASDCEIQVKSHVKGGNGMMG